MTLDNKSMADDVNKIMRRFHVVDSCIETKSPNHSKRKVIIKVFGHNPAAKRKNQFRGA